MARGDFFQGYLRAGAAPVTAVPLTLMAWGMTPAPAGGNDQAWLTLQNSAATVDQNNFSIGIFGGFYAASASSPTGTATANTFAIFPKDGVWAHVAGVFSLATSRVVYVNGVPSNVNTPSSTPSGVNETIVGARGGATPGQKPQQGNIAHAAIWNVALTQFEIAAIYAGLSPLRVRPANLIGYWPLGRASQAIEIDATDRNNTLRLSGYVGRQPNPGWLVTPDRQTDVELLLGLGGTTPIVGTGKAVGGGEAKAVGSGVKTGAGKAVGGGEAQAAGSGVKTGAGKAVGGGVARSSGSTVKAGTGAAVGGGVARSSGTAAKVGTGVAVGGGVARAAGSGSTSPTGTGKAVGGGTAAATGAATKAGAGRAVGGGVARASGFGIRSGTAIAVGGGVAKAAGGVVIPSVVDHYVKGWPVAASGAVIVHLVP